MNKPEVLSFSFQEIYLSRALIQSRKHLIFYLKFLSSKYKIPAQKIIFNHDLEDSNDKGLFIDNFKLKDSYDYLRTALK